LIGVLEGKTIQSRQKIGDMSVHAVNRLREQYGINVGLLDFMEGMNRILPDYEKTDYAAAATVYMLELAR